MDILTATQIMFNIAATVAIIVVGAVLGVIGMEVIRTLRQAKRLATSVRGKLESFSVLSIMEKFFTSNRKKYHGK